MPTEAWSLTIADGSGNRYVIDSDGSAARVRFEPVTPAESSSGVYSGGEPTSRSLSAAEAQTVWTMALAVEADTPRHVRDRRMGTTAQHRRVGDVVVSVVIDGDGGAEIIAWCRDRLKANEP